MRELVAIGPRALEWREIDDPAIELPSDALVRPLAVAICDIDPMTISGVGGASFPVPLGHECAGEVIATGPEVAGFAPGDRVLVPWQISCGTCAYCERGLTTSCTGTPHRASYGFGDQGSDYGGALADLIRVPFADHMLVSLRDGVDPVAVAPLADNGATAYEAVLLGIEQWPGGEVLVVGLDLDGAGASIGLYAAALAPLCGASRTDYLDSDPERLALAERLGANAIEGPPPRRAGQYPVTIDASGSQRGLHCAIRSTAPSGVCTSISGAVHFGETSLPLRGMYDRYCSFHTGRASVRPLIPKLLDLTAGGGFQPELVISAVADWDDAADALLEPQAKLVIARERS
jgi:alcohol dehydrogenase